MRIGDVAMLLFAHKFSAGDYRFCRVVKVFEDTDTKVPESTEGTETDLTLTEADLTEDDPLVRTCVVEVAPRGARAIIYPHPKYRLTKMTVPVQRLCVYLPVEDQVKYAPGPQQITLDPAPEASGQEVAEVPVSPTSEASAPPSR